MLTAPLCYQTLFDLTNKQFGLWSVLGYAGKGKWYCRCECGFEKVVVGATLRNGRSTKCGNCNIKKVQQGRAAHRLSKDRDRPYSVWWDMISRCEDSESKSYHYYGGRGISVCARWHDILKFYEDMGARPSRRHSIDRIDNNGNYGPGNCRWATKKEQERNRRNNKWLRARGERRTLAEWSEIVGLKPSTIGDRLRLGWTPEDAIFKPVKKQRRRYAK